MKKLITLITTLTIVIASYAGTSAPTAGILESSLLTVSKYPRALIFAMSKHNRTEEGQILVCRLPNTTDNYGTVCVNPKGANAWEDLFSIKFNGICLLC